VTDAVALLELSKTLLPFLLEHGSRAVQRRRKPQRALDNALQLALAQVDAVYPDLTASLFDETFIRHRAKPLFQRYFQGSGWPNPDELASAWLAELGQMAATPNLAYALEGAHAFLCTLEDELRKDPTFAHVFKNRLIAQLTHVEEILSSQMGPLLPVRDLRADGFELGDHEAATFPYRIAPIQTEWDRTVKALQAAAQGQGKRGLMVLGAANAGKTRLEPVPKR
jgi:hypothetical protein